MINKDGGDNELNTVKNYSDGESDTVDQPVRGGSPIDEEPDKVTVKMLSWLSVGTNLFGHIYVLFIIIAAAVLVNLKYYSHSMSTTSGGLLVIFWVLLALAAAVAIAVVANLTVRRPLPDGARIDLLRKRTIKKIIGEFIVGDMVIFVYLPLFINVGGGMDLSEQQELNLASVCIAMYLILMIYHCVNLVIISKLRKKCITVAEGGQIYNKLDDISALSKLKLTERVHKYDDRRTAVLKSKGLPPKTAQGYKRERILKRAVAVFVAAAIAAAVLLTAAFFPRERVKLSYAEKISTGDYLGYAVRLLGEPYKKSDVLDGTETYVTGGTWYWCDSGIAAKLASKYKQLENYENSDNIEKVLKLSEEIATLEQKLAASNCNYIIITYKNNSSSSSFDNYIITQLKFLSDYSFMNSGGAETVVKLSYAVIRNIEGRENSGFSTDNAFYKYAATLSVPQKVNLTSVSVREYFSDGSMLNKEIEIAADTFNKGYSEVIWNDGYGNHTLFLEVY